MKVEGDGAAEGGGKLVPTLALIPSCGDSPILSYCYLVFKCIPICNPGLIANETLYRSAVDHTTSLTAASPLHCQRFDKVSTAECTL